MREGRSLTFDLVRTPPVASIQMYLSASQIVKLATRTFYTYSAIAFPFWSRDMYFKSYTIVSLVGSGVISEIGNLLTLAVYETVVEPAIFAVLGGLKWEELVVGCGRGTSTDNESCCVGGRRKRKRESEDRELVLYEGQIREGEWGATGGVG